MMTSPRPVKPLTGRKVLVWFVGFFLIVFGANFIMSWFAITTFSGVETKDAYVKGRDYNVEIARAEEQKALGWTIAVKAESLSKDEIFLTLTIKDKGGAPLEAMSVDGLLVRSVHEGVDQKIAFASLGGGKYAGASQLPLLGKWQLRATVTGPSGRERKIIHDILVHS